MAVLYVADHPKLPAGHRRQVITLDAAYPDEPRLIARLEELLDAHVPHVVVIHLDLVRDLTVVDVRYRLPRPLCLILCARRRSPRGAGVTSARRWRLLARRSGRCRR